MSQSYLKHSTYISFDENITGFVTSCLYYVKAGLHVSDTMNASGALVFDGRTIPCLNVWSLEVKHALSGCLRLELKKGYTRLVGIREKQWEEGLLKYTQSSSIVAVDINEFNNTADP